MAYSKIKKILFILLCLFVILFPFWCVRGLCAETETVDFVIVDGLQITANSNAFVSNDSAHLAYFQTDPNYVYYIKNLNTSSGLRIATSSEVPSLNGIYNSLGIIEAGDTFTYRGNGLLYVNINTSSGGRNIEVTREKLTNMDGAISDLVDNVGINSIWNIFDISINYIVIVVVFALGCFIIFKLIKKVTKGKEEF